eukprot:scaffold10084_cov139-Isochrysis_galbana.AAC.3
MRKPAKGLARLQASRKMMREMMIPELMAKRWPIASSYSPRLAKCSSPIFHKITKRLDCMPLTRRRVCSPRPINPATPSLAMIAIAAAV